MRYHGLMNLMQLVAELDEVLDADAVKDSCPNGLQVEGRPDVSRVITGVSASRALFTRAVDRDAETAVMRRLTSGLPSTWRPFGQESFTASASRTSSSSATSCIRFMRPW
jgi:hypothetical protein